MGSIKQGDCTFAVEDDEFGKYGIDEISSAYTDFEKLNFRLQKAITVGRNVVESQSNGTWFDYGCGWGVLLWHMSKFKPEWQFIGCDADEHSLKIQEAFFSQRNVCAELKPYDHYMCLPEGAYDVVSFMEVIEHVENPGQVLRAFWRSLKKDGLLILSTPNAHGWNYLSNEFRRLLNRFVCRRNDVSYLELIKARAYNPATEEGHLTQFSVETLERILRVTGFEVISFHCTHQRGSLFARMFKDGIIVVARKV